MLLKKKEIFMKEETPVVIEEVISVDFNVVGTLNSQWWCFGCLTKRSLKSICLFPLNTPHVLHIETT